jgi:predicted MPP superfamily phosphohydrolase
LAAIVGCVFLIGAVAWHGARDIRVTRLDIPLRNLPRELDGLSIVQISDFHYGVLNLNQRLDRVVDLANGLNPNVIFITGDLVDESVAHMEEMGPSLLRFKSKAGVYAVTGNHDYYAGVERATRIMRGANIRVLRNEVEILAGGLQILGVDDPTGRRRMGEPGTDFENLIAGVDPAKPSILLYHQPIQFEKAAKTGIGLQLSGHTHGGQLYPVIYISKQIYPWTPGLHRIGDSYLYVSKGVGTWGPPLRFLVPPEIVYIRLKSEMR